LSQIRLHAVRIVGKVEDSKVFCFFFSKKKCLPLLGLPSPDCPASPPEEGCVQFELVIRMAGSSAFGSEGWYYHDGFCPCAACEHNHALNHLLF
jgi:hypothetical protein